MKHFNRKLWLNSKKRIVIDSHCKTICAPVRSECSSCRVYGKYHPLKRGAARHPVWWATRPVSKQRLTLSEISRIVFLSSTHVRFIQWADTRLLCWTNHPMSNCRLSHHLKKWVVSVDHILGPIKHKWFISCFFWLGCCSFTFPLGIPPILRVALTTKSP